MPVYTIIICDYYNNQEYGEMEVEADSLEEAKEIGYEEWLNGLKERTYAEVVETYVEDTESEEEEE